MTKLKIDVKRKVSVESVEQIEIELPMFRSQVIDSSDYSCTWMFYRVDKVGSKFREIAVKKPEHDPCNVEAEIVVTIFDRIESQYSFEFFAPVSTYSYRVSSEAEFQAELASVMKHIEPPT